MFDDEALTRLVAEARDRNPALRVTGLRVRARADWLDEHAMAEIISSDSPERSRS